MWGDITVTGADTQAVTIVSNIKNKQQASAKNSAGLRRLRFRNDLYRDGKGQHDHDRAGRR